MLGSRETRELRALAQLFKEADRETQKQLRRASQQLAPIVRGAAMRRAHDPVSQKIAASGKVTVSPKGLKAVFGASGKHGSAKLRELAAPWEFGGNRERKDTYRSQRGGSSFPVTRRTQRQIPSKTPTGRFIYPAVADVAPQIVGVWARALMEVFDDGR